MNIERCAVPGGDPEAGDVMPGTGGFRKLRWAIRAEARASVVASG